MEGRVVWAFCQLKIVSNQLYEQLIKSNVPIRILGHMNIEAVAVAVAESCYLDVYGLVSKPA